MKILHTSDWHLGRRPVGGIGEYTNKRYEDYFKAAEYIVDKAIELSVDIFLISGDLFDKSTLLPDILYRTEKILEKLKNNNIITLIIEGNHDKIYNSDDSWINYLENKNLVKVPKIFINEEKIIFEPIKINDINFYGLGYPGAFIDKYILDLNDQLNPDEKNIIMVHTALAGEFLPGCISSENIDILKEKVLYIAGGHIHTFKTYPKDNPFFFIPGCPEYWDLNEKDEKGFIIFDTETKEYEFYHSLKRKILRREIEYNNNFEIIEKFIEELEFEKDEEIIILKIKNSSKFSLDTEKIEKLLKEKGALKAVVQIDHVYEKSNEEYYEITDKNAIERKVVESWDNIFSADSKKTVKFLDKLKSMEHEGIKGEELFDVFDNFLSSFIIEGDINENKKN
ncbi:nuclease SbcCD subunit D [Marinitoga sp. 1197]|uniref:metallophosphoesterase family protein n=1 Tax=Marinitoga sp. 1197 TaxID=1428449 RepID=UPI0006413B2E|nr:exonuclease SbcCD subunit D [Marinitoga sp. 1197]KLO21989.1 nuclease SbcCD subunit D [Marinitoga sp. 1197]